MSSPRSRFQNMQRTQPPVCGTFFSVESKGVCIVEDLPEHGE